MEILIFPKMIIFAKENDYKLLLCEEQNAYPDLTFIDTAGNKYAVDIKSTYRKNNDEVNGMTLGAFTGYFRDRKSKKNSVFPYGDYVGHFVLGIVYSRNASKASERKVYKIEDLININSVIKDITFFVQEKHLIAVDRPGSGNTKNIGSVNKIKDLIEGNGPFKKLGEDVFDDYWMYYLTKDMAKEVELKTPPYRNLTEYFEYKKVKSKKRSKRAI